MLARDLAAQAPAGTELICRTRAELDVTSEAAVTAATVHAKPDVIVNCAAFTNVDGAEAERDRAFAVNGRGPAVIARAAVSIRNPQSPIRNPLVVHFSTDYVFNGQSRHPYREDDPTDPIGAYGESKLAGERGLLESGTPCLIIRTSWLFGFHGKSFPRTMWQRAREGKATRVVSDQEGRPTYTVDLARATWALIGQRTTDNGQRSVLWHIANTGQATWYEIALRIFRAAGVPDLVSPCTTTEYPTPAKRPAYSVFDTSRYDALAGAPLPRWEDALDRFLAELEAA